MDTSRHFHAAVPQLESRILGLAAQPPSTSHEGGDRQQTLLAQLGRSVLGPALGGFTAWIGHVAEQAEADLVVFSSRDGWLPYQVAQTMAWGTRHRLRYGHFSRRALYVPGLAAGLDNQDIGLLTGGLWPSSVGQLLGRCGLDPSEYEQEISRAGFADTNAKVAGTAERQRMGALFRRLEPDIRRIGVRELEQLCTYLEQTGLLAATRLLFIDIGWRGTLQRSLQRCLKQLGSTTEVIGAYLGILWTPVAYDGQRLLGWLCDETDDPRTHDIISHAIPLFEACFQADQPSVQGYRNGAPLYGSPARSRELCDPLQAAALEFCRDTLALLDGGAIHRAMGRPLLHLADHPTAAQAALLGRYTYADGFGTNDEERPLLRLPLHLRSRTDLRLLRHEREYCSWKPGFDALLADKGWLKTVTNPAYTKPPLSLFFRRRNRDPVNR